MRERRDKMLVEDHMNPQEKTFNGDYLQGLDQEIIPPKIKSRPY
jgi:hypothetical protein